MSQLFHVSLYSLVISVPDPLTDLPDMSGEIWKCLAKGLISSDILSGKSKSRTMSSKKFDIYRTFYSEIVQWESKCPVRVKDWRLQKLCVKLGNKWHCKLFSHLSCVTRKRALRSLLLHSKRRIGRRGPANPSVGMTPTTEYNLRRQQSSIS